MAFELSRYHAETLFTAYPNRQHHLRHRHRETGPFSSSLVECTILVGPALMIGIDSSSEVVLLPRLPLYERGKEPVQQMSQPAIHVWYEHELLPGIDSAHTARRHSRWLCAVSVRVNFSDGTTINGRSAKTPGNSRGNGEDEGNGGVLDSKGLVEQKRRAFRGAVKGTCWGRHKACK